MSTSKKPPAHEVIIARLRQLAQQWECDSPSHVPEYMHRAEEHVIALMRMHIPEQTRGWVVDALRHLPPGMLPPMVVDLYAEIEGDKGGA